MQKVFAMMGYAGWMGLTAAGTREKAAPFRAELKDAWARLNRAQPEQQSTTKPWVKPKWDEVACCLVQDAIYQGMDDGVLSLNAGASEFAVLALIRATCSRPGAVAKDAFDVSGAIGKWARTC